MAEKRTIGDILEHGWFMNGPSDQENFEYYKDLEERIKKAEEEYKEEDVFSIKDIFERDTPKTEDLFELSEGFTLSPITLLRRYLAKKELEKKGLANGGMTNMLGTGGITGNKTYHQYHDQFVPIDSEAAGYANGGGVGSMMVPRKNYNQGGSTSSYDSRATVEDMAKAIQSSSAANNDQKLQMLMDYDNSYRHSPSLGPKSWTNSNQTSMEKLLGITPSSKFSYNNPYQPAMIMPPMTSTGFNQNSGSFGNQGIIINGKRYMSEQEAIDDMGLQTYNQFMADGGRVKPKRGLVNEPGGYAGWEENDIFVEDLSPISTPHRIDDGFLITAANPLKNQSGVIDSAPKVMENAGVTTITNSGINSFNKPNMRQVAGEVNIDPFSNTVAPVPNKASWEGYVDLIQNPENNPNALNWQRTLNNIDNEPFQEIKGIDFKDAPIEKWSNRENHPMKGWWDKNVRYKALNDGTPESTAKWLNKKGYELPENLKGIDTRNWLEKTTDKFSNLKDGITSVGQRFKEGANMVFSPISALANMRNPLNPKSQNYNPDLANQLNFVDKTFPGMIVNNPSSGLLQYAEGSPLQGQAVMSGWGTNDVIGQLEKQAARHQKTIDNFANQWGNLKETDEDAYNQKLQIHKERLAKVNDMMNQIVENQKKQAAALALKEKQKEDRKTGGDGNSGWTPVGHYGKKQGTTGSWTPGGSYTSPSPKGYSSRSHSGGNYGGAHHWADGGIISLKR